MNVDSVQSLPRRRAWNGSVIVSLIALVVPLMGAWVNMAAPGAMSALCCEDGLVESLTAISYALSALLLYAAARCPGEPRTARWMLGLLFLFVAGEEISWGQRIIGLETPSIVANVNVQQEFNVHNLWPLHGSIRALGLMFITAYGIALPILAYYAPRLRGSCKRLRIPLFTPSAIALLVSGILIMAVPRLLFGQISFELDELGEALLSFGFLFLAINEFQRTAVERRSLSRTSSLVGGAL